MARSTRKTHSTGRQRFYCHAAVLLQRTGALVARCFDPAGQGMLPLHRSASAEIGVLPESAVITLALLVTTLAVQTPDVVRSRDSARPESVILEVRIGSIASTTVSALRIGDRALLPAARVFALAEVTAADPPERYLSVDSLSGLLHADITVDWDDLTATISDDGTLPASRRVVRRERRDLFNATNGISAVSPAVSRTMPLLPHSFMLDYEVTTSSAFTLTQPAVRLTLGSSMLGGGLDVDWNRFGRTSSAPPAISWQRVWPEGSRVRYVRFGSIPFSPSSIVRSGLLVSNHPPLYDDDAETVVFAGVAGRDWEVEAYRDGVLAYAGVVDSSGAYMLSIPALRGTNRLALIAYGPGGEQRVTNRYVSIGNDMLPAGTGSYTAAVGNCASVRCDRAAELSLRYAPDHHVTAGVELAAFTGARGLVFTPAAAFSARVSDDINAGARYGRSDAAADFRYSPSADFDVVAAYRSTAIDPIGAPIAHGVLARRSTVVATAAWRPGGSYAIDATVDLAGGHLTDEQRIRVASSASVGSAYLRPFATLARGLYVPSPAPGFGAYVEMAAPPLLRSILPVGSRIRGSAGLGGDRPNDTFVALAIPFMRTGRIEAATRWGSASGTRTPQLELSVNLIASAVRYEARSDGYANSRTVTSALSGSVAVAHEREAASRIVTLSAMPFRGRAVVAGRVFLDNDADGVLDSSDELLPGVSVIAGASTVETDSTGEYRTADVAPYAALVLSADSLTLPPQDLVVRPVRVIPLPGGVTRVDLAVVRASASGLAVRCLSRIRGLTQDPQSRDTTSIHGDDFQPGARNPHPVTNPRQPAQPCEDVSAQR